jgi:endogenous inhibitor of DNA gyrase (YacG/DUF329 family)
MRFNRTHPQCPECKKTISFLQGLAMWNPWKVSCPACKAALEMSRISKAVSIFGGLGWAGVAICMEEMKLWTTKDSLVFFALSLPIIVAVGYILWPKTKLYAKRKNA